MDPMGFMADMQLLGILHFQERELGQRADDIVDGLLREVHGSDGEH